MNILSFIRPSLVLYVVQIEKKTYVTNVYDTPHICNCLILTFGYAFFLPRLLEKPKFKPGQHRSSRFEFRSFKKPLFLMIRLQPLQPPGHGQPSVIHSSPHLQLMHSRLQISHWSLRFKLKLQPERYKSDLIK